MTRVGGEWVTKAATQSIFDFLLADGHSAYFVGGCVRNALLGEPVNDIDIATDRTPDDVAQRAACKGIRAVPTGIDHGTVTLVLAGCSYEVTTFRRDVRTDGRRAEVSFSTRMDDDAARRDFTMNALYADRHGAVEDPLGQGLADLEARRVRFIGDAAARIREDYLRSLRFFRFFAWYGAGGNGPDPDALSAIATHLDGLAALSRERVGQEMRKLVAAPHPSEAMGAMSAVHVLSHVLPGADAQAFGPLCHLEEAFGLAPDPIRRLASLGGRELAESLRLSRAETRDWDQIRTAALDAAAPHELGYRLGTGKAWSAFVLRAALLGLHPAVNPGAAIDRGAAARFPVVAADLMPHFTGSALGKRLAELETAWIASEFSITKDDLLRML
ncbi:MAG: CCA tRNA nucleotidyltransferase [Pseudomonadota bacterium]